LLKRDKIPSKIKIVPIINKLLEFNVVVPPGEIQLLPAEAPVVSKLLNLKNKPIQKIKIPDSKDIKEADFCVLILSY
jgi:hypothetical protein